MNNPEHVCYAVCRNLVRNADCQYAECHKAKRHYSECRGAFFPSTIVGKLRYMTPLPSANLEKLFLLRREK
jgi:hypothetical protein